MSAPATERWSSHIAFILAAIGAAVGIGNIWRFPALLGQNGGGAYLVPYFIAVFLFALPLMVLEIAMGRHFRSSVVSSFRAIRPRFQIIGWLLVAILFLILSYYIVITGWTIAYAVFSATGDTTPFAVFTASYLPVAYGALAVVLTGIVVALGIRTGIERVSVLMVPVIVGILIIMVLFSTTLSGFGTAVRFLFTPDFTVLTHAGIWVAAFGQAFFSLSVGEGILLTYGAYMARDQDIPRASVVICVADLAVALLAGLVIFPIVFSFDLAPAAGTQLAFTTLPLAFTLLPAGRLFAVAFFVVLFFAAFTSSVSMLEVAVSSLEEASGWSRRKTVSVLTGVLLLVSLVPALSFSAMNLSLFGVPVLDIMDETVGTLGLHLAAALLAIAFTWFVPRTIFEEETGGGSPLTGLAFLLCKYVIPAVLLATIGIHLIAGVEMPDATYVAGEHFLNAWLQSGMLAVLLVGIIAVILIIRAARH